MDSSLLSYFIVSMVSFTAGLLVGYFAKSMLDKTPDKNTGNMIVLVIVSTIWALSMIIDIASPNYETSPLVHGLMGAIVGFFYKTNARDSK